MSEKGFIPLNIQKALLEDPAFRKQFLELRKSWGENSQFLGDMENVVNNTDPNDYTSFIPGDTDVVVINTPSNRNIGSKIFRRYPNGRLDINEAANLICSILKKIKNNEYLIDQEKYTLASIFPDYTDVPSYAATIMGKISDEEKKEVVAKVRAIVSQELLHYFTQN